MVLFLEASLEEPVAWGYVRRARRLAICVPAAILCSSCDGKQVKFFISSAII
jgi:hypothetical protein